MESANKSKKLKITSIDKKIINVLQASSRLSCREISKKVGVSAVTVMKRINYLVENKIIRRFGVWLNHEKLGYDICAIVQLKLANETQLETERKIALNPNVLRVYDVTGNFDSLVITKLKTRKQLDKFIKEIRGYPGVIRTETMLVFNILKEDFIKIQ